MVKTKPNFIVIGAGKSGTTTLCHLLDQHPQIFMSNPKEPRFFSLDENFERGWEWYKSCFLEANNEVAIGEGSVNYTMRTAYPKAASRIAAALPEVKLIYIVRHPLERIESNWRMGAWENSNFPSFDKALRDDSLKPALIDRSKYWFQVSAYRDYFADHQILVLFFEDFILNQEQVLQQCYKFLGVDLDVKIADQDIILNKADTRHKSSSLMTRLNQISGLNTVSKILPEKFRHKIRDSLVKKGPDKPKWKAKTHQWVIEQLIEDTHTFLEFYGKPQNFWDFDLEYLDKMRK